MNKNLQPVDNIQPYTGINNDSKTVKKYSVSKNRALAVAVVVILIISALWIWKTRQIVSVKMEYENREAELAQKTNAIIEEMNKHFLKLFARPYVWAVRNEMLEGNLKRINLYGNEMIKEKNFISVMVVNMNGKIISATNKKYENADFISISHPYYLSVDSSVLNKISDSLYIVASPVMGLNSKLGTVIINYGLDSTDMIGPPDIVAKY